ncbi:hypothetical protein CALVIDRAFT_535709 [Calocera viscosa TUFC12733]|uniref:Uncharacterized protein n=1 Tax=Calocera viscosa (strain TUFC12733) TaxID=1330018 RepID=A0A167NVC1_CALVF|nr:hypothetical protein CALVIDRAFT_535709 [Calocera viscosa TUFC12733]
MSKDATSGPWLSITSSSCWPVVVYDHCQPGHIALGFVRAHVISEPDTVEAYRSSIQRAVVNQ